MIRAIAEAALLVALIVSLVYGCALKAEGCADRWDEAEKIHRGLPKR